MAKPASTEQLSFGLIVLDPEKHRLQAMQKSRRCLSCTGMFVSHGPGNRICQGCKSRDGWGTAPDAHPLHAAF